MLVIKTVDEPLITEIENNDERWGPEISVPDFSQAAKNPEYQQAVADLGKICGGQPKLDENASGCFQVTVDSLLRDEIRTEVLQQQFLQRGCFVYEPDSYFDAPGPKQLCILPTTDKYDVIAFRQTDGCNYGIGTGYIIEWLKELEITQPLILTLISFDTLSGRFLTPVQNPEELAIKMYEFCPDIVDQGCGSLEMLVEILSTSDQLYFWWD